MMRQLIPDPIRRKIQERRRNKLLAEIENAASIVEFRGCKFFARRTSKIEATLLRLRLGYDTHNHEVLAKFLHKGMSCLDVGANIGVYTVHMARLVGPSGSVHSFEPVTHVRRRLEANVWLNNLQWVKINNTALGHKVDSIEMFQVREGHFRSGTSTLVKNENVDKMGEDSFSKTLVSVTTIDDYVTSHSLDQLGFMKIDVEGFEWNVLLGASESIRRFKPTILMEYDPIRHEGKKQNIIDFFDEQEFYVYEFCSFGPDIVLVPFNFSGQPLGRNILCMRRW